jgi:L-arabinokinase
VTAAPPAAGTPAAVFYISGHGFGHASRVIETINALGAIAPGTRLIVRSSVARWLLEATLKPATTLCDVVTDTGIVQPDSLHLDIPATARACADFYATFGARAAGEASFLRECGAVVVVSDMPPLAFEAAHLAGVPVVAHGNFTWDWIYEAYPELLARAPHAVPTIRAAYARAALALRLPMWGGFDGWTCPIVDVPFVARHSERDRDEVRAALGIAPGRRMALASFGGLGISALKLEALARLDGYTVVTTGHALGLEGRVPDGVVLLDDREVYGRGWRYEDLVHAADAVVSKPGYGIIAECVANGTPLLYTSRGHFVEYDALVAAMPRYLRCGFIGHDDLYAGRWAAHLDALVAMPAPPETARTDGALVTARHILSFLTSPGDSR